MPHKLWLLASFIALGAYGAYELYHRLVTCQPHVQADVLSPDGARRAVLYNMDCEATSGLDTHLALMPPGGEFKPERYPPVFVLDGSHDVRVSWQDGRTLIVDLPAARGRIQQQDTEAGLVRIRYRKPGES
ncbi:MAG: hypothetical protein ACK4NA_14395 [Alphaproteobacteria bacterium]